MSEYTELPPLISRKTFRRVSGLSDYAMAILIATKSIRRMRLYPTARKGMYYKADLGRITGLT
jgi:hypothetical protein